MAIARAPTDVEVVLINTGHKQTNTRKRQVNLENSLFYMVIMKEREKKLPRLD